MGVTLSAGRRRRRAMPATTEVAPAPPAAGPAVPVEEPRPAGPMILYDDLRLEAVVEPSFPVLGHLVRLGVQLPDTW